MARFWSAGTRASGFMRRLRGDDGYALGAVLGLAVVMMLLAVTAASATSSLQRKSKSDSDWTASYYAASAGLSDYQSRLASISNYNLYGNPAATFSSGSAPLTLPGPSDPLYNTAFGSGASGTWSQVPCRTATCSSGTPAAYFRYEVNTKDFSTRGIIHVRSTGKVGERVRSVIADFRRNGLFNFVYYTNFEIQDPAISGENTACASYHWTGRAASCNEVQFGQFDTLNGDVFSNDQFFVCGATFLGRVQSAAPTTPTNYPPVSSSDCAGGTPAASYAYAPQNTASIALPPSNATLSTEARADTYTGASPGCMYTGPTSITFLNDGTMTVISPLTKVTQPSYTGGVPSRSPASCGVVGTGSNQLGSIGGANIPVPDDNLVYVQSVPTAASDPNFTSLTTGGWTSPTTNNTTYACWTQTGARGYSDDPTAPLQTIAGWRLTKTGPGAGSIQYPLADEDYVPTPTGTSAYQCDSGDLYVSGTLKGHVTLATDRNIYVTRDITYASSNPSGSSYNLLGLVANVALVVWNPQNYNGQTNLGGGRYKPSTSILLTDTDRQLYAAALAVKGTVMVQNYNVGGPRGTLHLVGSIEQNFRGTVATGSGSTTVTGYRKQYDYDTNLRYNAPPKYLSPANATFAISQIASVPAAFSADGSPR